MKIAFVGGGTGGHFYPLIAVAEELATRSQQPELYYFGPNPYNPEALKAHNITHIYCPAGKVRRYFSLLNILDGFKLMIGMVVAFFKLFWLYPDVIFSKGGYTSVPILLLARFYRIPVVIHESDSRPGRANLLARKFARYIGIAFDEVADYFPAEKTALVGIPIQKAISYRNPDPHATLGIPQDLPLLYVTGGSLGSERINNLILDSLDELLPHFRIFHQTGDAHADQVIRTAQGLISDQNLLSHYYVQGTLPATTISAILDAAAIIVSRAGSTTIFEIAMHAKPSIIIPIPEAISHDQRTNAYAYARSGAATVLEEGNITANLLAAEIMSILENQEKYQAMQTAATQFAPRDAAAKIADALISIAQEHGS